MSALPGRSYSAPRTLSPGTRLPSTNQGGRPMNTVVGMATVAAGLGAFWMLQFRTENRNPAEIPTWQYLHAQQAPGVNARVSTPSSSTKASVQRSERAHRRTHGMPSGGSATDPVGQKEVSPSSVRNDVGRQDKGPVVASILAMIHGDPKDTNRGEQVGQPAPIRRLNDRGGVYTKNSDYKDSYRRE